MSSGVRFIVIFCFAGVFVGAIQPEFSLFGFDEIQAHRSTAVDLATAGAQTAIADGLESFYRNPAGISRRAGHRYFAMGHRAIDRFTQWGIQGGIIDGKTEHPLHWGALFNLAHTKQMKFQDYAFAMSYRFYDFILVGLTQNITNFRLARLTPKRWTYGVGLGTLVFVTEQIGLGLAVDNAYRTFKNSQLQPLKYSGGISVNFVRWRLGADIERNHSQKKTFFRSGAEVQVPSLVRLRGGFFSERQGDELGYSVGLGVEPSSGVLADVGFLDQLKSSNQVYSAGISFSF